jgi:hypothetical protein
MFVGIGVGVHRQRFAGSFATSYSSRVIADGGTIEALDCVAAASSLLQSASLLIIPSGYKAGVAYAELPANGNGDLTWSRNSVANRTQSDGNIGSVAANVARLSYMYGSCPALLLEPQRTNSIRNSTMQGASTSPSTFPTNWMFIGDGLTGTIVGIGTENGLPYVEIRMQGTATGINARLDFESQSQIVASNGQAWTNSFYYRRISGNPDLVSLRIFERTSTGSYITENALNFTPNTTLLRYTQTYTLNGGATVARVQSGIRFTLTIGNTYDFTIRIAAPQMELGAYATTWIDTTNAAATRLADTFTRNNIYTNGLISASGGTWYVELRNNVGYTRDTFTVGLFISDTTNITSNNINIRNGGGGAVRLSINKVIAGVSTALYMTTTNTVKLAIKWNGTSADIFENGVKVISATSFTPTIMENLGFNLGQVPNFIQAMALYPTPLSDSDCTTLTT